MNIVFSANNNQEIAILPVIPEESPELPIPRKNEVFETTKGDINLIGDRGLKVLNIQTFFPTKSYPFIKKGAVSDGWQYVNFFNKWANLKRPIRIVITTNAGIEMLNMACTVENFNYYLDKVGDIQYTLEVKEYKFLTVKKV